MGDSLPAPYAGGIMESTWAGFQRNCGRLEHHEEDDSQSSGAKTQTDSGNHSA